MIEEAKKLRELYEIVYPAIRLIVWRFKVIYDHEPSPDEFEQFVQTADPILRNMWEQMKWAK